MLDLKFIRENFDLVKENLINRNNNFDLNKVLELDRKRRELLQETEKLKSRRNIESKNIAIAKKKGEDASAAIAEMRKVGGKIKGNQGKKKHTNKVKKRTKKNWIRLENKKRIRKGKSGQKRRKQ